MVSWPSLKTMNLDTWLTIQPTVNPVSILSSLRCLWVVRSEHRRAVIRVVVYLHLHGSFRNKASRQLQPVDLESIVTSAFIERELEIPEVYE